MIFSLPTKGSQLRRIRAPILDDAEKYGNKTVIKNYVERIENNLEQMYKKWGKSFCSEFSLQIKPFAASHSPPCWRAKAKVAQGQDKQKANIILNGNFLCLSHPSATFALQHGSFVPCE